MVKERFTWYKCRKCGLHQHELDWDYKNRNLFFILKKQRLCEECARRGKNERS